MTSGLVLPRSAIAVAIEALRPHFPPSVPIRSRAPQSWPSRWIRVSRIGGRKDWALDHPLLLVECWASTSAGGRDSAQAEQDALTAYTALEGRSGAVVYFEGGHIAELDDPDRAHARFQFTGTVGVGIS